MSGSPTPGSPTKQKKTLDSEVSTEEAEALLTFVQTISSSFRGFLADEVTVLSENLSVMRFDEEQVVMQKGESGSWFGVLLSGTLTVKITDTKRDKEDWIRLVMKLLSWWTRRASRCRT